MWSRIGNLEGKIKTFQANLDGTLKDLLVEERIQNKKLLLAYAKLKVKYDNLLKLRELKKDTSTSEDSDVILLTREWRGKNEASEDGGKTMKKGKPRKGQAGRLKLPRR